MLLFLTTNMAAVMSRANQQLESSVEFFFKEAEKNFDPLDNFFQGAGKERTLRISFFNAHRQKFEGSDSSHPSGRGGGGCR